MAFFAVIGGLLILLVLLDAFETVVVPRRVLPSWRLARLFLRGLWALWSYPARHGRNSERRETYLSVYGPFALILLLGAGATGMVAGFALIFWGLNPLVLGAQNGASFAASLYLSGSTFFTLGIADIAPNTGIGRALVILEAGTGFAFLALIIAYVPVLNQASSQREVDVSLLDARAGSPPSAVELLRRHAGTGQQAALAELFREWERWSAELLESHLSYPILAYYRSQHQRQSWLATLTIILDVSSLMIVGIEDAPPRAARMAFAKARHAAADLSHVLGTRPRWHGHDRLTAEDLERARALLRDAGVPLRAGHEADDELAKLRRMYEPFVSALAGELLMPLPSWLPTEGAMDAWQITRWRLSASDAADAGAARQESILAGR